MLTRDNFTRFLLVGLLLATLAIVPVLGVSLENQGHSDFSSLFGISRVESTQTGSASVIACVPPGGSQGCGGGCC